MNIPDNAIKKQNSIYSQNANKLSHTRNTSGISPISKKDILETP
jgi:hypothetical protein